MRIQITYALQARHLDIRDGRLYDIQTDQDAEVRSVTYTGRTAIVERDRGIREYVLPRDAVCNPDPGHLDTERGLLEADRLSLAVDTVARYPLQAMLSLYREERIVEVEGFWKRQCIGFYVLSLQEQSRSHVYADVSLVKLGELCTLHVLPACIDVPKKVPVILSPNVVGYIFHEWTHLLEVDILGYDAVVGVKGNPAFICSPELEILEDTRSETVGFNAFSDDGRVARQIPLVKDGRIEGFIDSSSFPCGYLGCGYLGYGNDTYPIPRTTNLVIRAKSAVQPYERALVVTGLEIGVLSSHPLRTRIRIHGGEGVCLEGGKPTCRLSWMAGGETTIQELVARMMFLDPGQFPIPTVGGLCMKKGIRVRSAQSAPAAMLDDPTILLSRKH